MTRPALSKPGAPGPATAAPPDDPGAAAPVVHVVDDDRQVRRSLGNLLQAFGIPYRAYDGGDSFLAADMPPADRDVVLLDMRMPGRSGLDVLAALRASNHQCGVVLISGHGGPALGRRHAAMNVMRVLEKPFDVEELIALIQARWQAPA